MGIIGKDIGAAVKQFFENGKLLKELNCTTLTLIPKIENPTSVLDFRPSCNVINKCITKLLCTRLKEVLPYLVSPNQTGFVEGKQIIQNRTIIQNIPGRYGRKSSPPGCLLKVDIQKAYDSVNWDFLLEMLQAFNFPYKFIQLIMACVTSPAYSLAINGNLEGFFHGKKGEKGLPQAFLPSLTFAFCDVHGN